MAAWEPWAGTPSGSISGYRKRDCPCPRSLPCNRGAAAGSDVGIGKCVALGSTKGFGTTVGTAYIQCKIVTRANSNITDAT